MKKQNTFLPLVLLTLVALSALNHQLSTAQAQSTAITYQGQLNSGAANANGSYDLRFAVYDANVAGNFIAGTTCALERTFNMLPVINWVPQITNPARAEGWLCSPTRRCRRRTTSGASVRCREPWQKLKH